MDAGSVKRVAGTCTELCLHLSVIFVMIPYFQCRKCSVVLSAITKCVEIQRAVILVQLNSCGSVSPAINERKGGLLRQT
jgi:hypothetical protein